MKYRAYFTIGLIVLAALAVEAAAAPKRAAQKKPAKLDSDVQAMWKSSFISYDVGTLRMTGRSGTSTVHSIGTLSMRGKRER